MANLDRRFSDAEVYEMELDFARRAEAVGYDSVWSSEHHFTNYQLTSQQMMVLAWVAGQTSHVKLGTFVTVLPWHDPIRVAESFSVLDHLSGGRSIMGLGRGLGQKEFVGFRSPMGESRRRFTEYSDAVLTGLETGVMEYDGDLYKQPRVEIRPDPLKSFNGRIFASAVSPESMEIMANMGTGLMVIAQKPWKKAIEELDGYRARFLELNGTEAPKPVLVIVAGVAKDPERADEIRRVNLKRWALSVVEQYEFDNIGFADIEGYEYYADLAKTIEKHGIDTFCDFLADLQVWGTPEQVTEKLLGYVEMCDAGALVVPTCFGGMTPAQAEDSFSLFASEVLPELKRHDVGGDIGITYDTPAPVHS
jgi:alkanesulfonate monooxygenase SsuD/methylene tetrahydromethanopterin reductase-like flavin-dependent oxidoreductase (luciferase family)